MVSLGKAIVLATILILAGCGGGGGGGAPSSPPEVVDPWAGVELQLPASASLDAPVGLAVSGVGATPLTYAWDFGDGGSASLASPSHDYRMPGNYTVRLRLSNASGASKELSRQLVVAPWSFLSGANCQPKEQGGWCRVSRTTLASAPAALTVAAFHDANTGWGAVAETLYRTTDGGRNWTATELNHSVREMLPIDAQTVWALGGAHQDRVSLSTDAGRSFAELTLPTLGGRAPSRVVLLGANLVASYGDGLTLASADRGQTWRPGTMDHSVAQVEAGSALWRLNAAGVSRSDDGGVSYQLVSQLPAVCSRGGLKVYGSAHLVVDQGVDRKQACASHDGGASWTPLPVFSAQPNDRLRVVQPRRDGGYFSLTSAADRHEILVTDMALSEWTAFPSVFLRALVRADVSDAQRAVLYSYSSIGDRWSAVVTLDSGRQWIGLDTLSQELQSALGPVVKTLGGGALLRNSAFTSLPEISRDNGRTWSSFPVAVAERAPAAGRVVFLDAKLGIAGGYGDSSLSQTFDGGRNWQPVSGLGFPTPNWAAISDGTLWVGGSFGLLFSKDRGQSWNRPEAWFDPVRSMDLDRGDWWLVGTSTGTKRSLDAGKTWLHGNNPSPVRFVKTLDAPRGLAVYEEFAGACLRFTEDRGASWSGCNSLDPERARRIRAVAHQGSSIWLVGEGGLLLFSPDAGQSWQDLPWESSWTSAIDSRSLNDIRFVNPQRGWIVGDEGVILATEDGGKTWKRQARLTDRSLTHISVLGNSMVWVAGNGVLLGAVLGGP